MLTSFNKDILDNLKMEMAKKVSEEILKETKPERNFLKETLEATRERAHELLMLSREQKEELVKSAKRIEELENKYAYLINKNAHLINRLVKKQGQTYKINKNNSELEKEIKYLTGKVEIKEKVKRDALEKAKALEEKIESLTDANEELQAKYIYAEKQASNAISEMYKYMQLAWTKRRW